MARHTQAVIDLGAIQHNYRQIKTQAANSQVLAVVKANAYGHGVERVSAALSESDGFGVALLEEGLQLRSVGIKRPVVLLEGVTSSADLITAAEHQLDVVVHCFDQLEMLEHCPLIAPIKVWLKFNTGMHRLGIETQEVSAAYERLSALSWVSKVVFMSHFACADEIEHLLTSIQLQKFNQAVSQASERKLGLSYECSLANSAGLLSRRDSHFDWVRPGLSLYGGSPFANKSAAQLGLRAAMSLQASILSIRQVQTHETLGYGAIWQAQAPGLIATVGIGYGDGYPRHIGADTPVLIKGQTCPIVGRVSMDMLAVDLSPLLQRDCSVNIGDEVILWGDGLPIEIIADAANTVNYELFCQVTARVKRMYR